MMNGMCKRFNPALRRLFDRRKTDVHGTPELHVGAVFTQPESGDMRSDLSVFRRQVASAFKLLQRSVGSARRKLVRQIDILADRQFKLEESQKVRVVEMRRLVQSQSETHSATLSSIDSQLHSLRDYAAEQQKTLVRYQQGFNWVINKDLCKRIIRSLDDIERYLADENITALHREHLDILRDQLVFALDSNGVEQVTVEIGTQYDSVRKEVEFLEYVASPDAARCGQIAEARPGYVVYTSDEDTPRKIRDIQVKVYESSSKGAL